MPNIFNRYFSHNTFRDSSWDFFWSFCWNCFKCFYRDFLRNIFWDSSRTSIFSKEFCLWISLKFASWFLRESARSSFSDFFLRFFREFSQDSIMNFSQNLFREFRASFRDFFSEISLIISSWISHEPRKHLRISLSISKEIFPGNSRGIPS